MHQDAECWPTCCSTFTKQSYGAISYRRHVANMSCTMPTCLAARSVQLYSRFSYPSGSVARPARGGLCRSIPPGHQVDRQADPAPANIRQRTKERTARKELPLVELLVDPSEGVFEDKFRLLLSACELGFSRQAIVANLLLDLVHLSNLLSKLLIIFAIVGLLDRLLLAGCRRSGQHSMLLSRKISRSVTNVYNR
jgi:hypothetical protein